MGGKIVPMMIVIVLVIVLGVAVFFFLPQILKTDNDGGNTGAIVDETIPPTVSVKQEVNEEAGAVIVSASSEDSEVTVEKIDIQNVKNNEIMEEVDGNYAEFEVKENGKYKVTAYGNNTRTITKTINVTNVPEEKHDPYIPQGFRALDESIDPNDGFVIVDREGNQYVWVPVGTGKLTRTTAFDRDAYEDDASELTNSVSKYYGFYIARFEASQYSYNDGYIAASMPGKIPWGNLTYGEALSASKAVAESLGYDNCSTNLISSYAWDTVMDWIDKDENTKDYSQSTDYGNYDGQLVPTGDTERDRVKNICDLAGNVKEWSTETDKGLTETKSKESKDKTKVLYKIIRGGSADLQNPAGSRKGYGENSINETWGFRFILYQS